jgi:hypothetical protein
MSPKKKAKLSSAAAASREDLPDQDCVYFFGRSDGGTTLRKLASVREDPDERITSGEKWQDDIEVMNGECVSVIDHAVDHVDGISHPMAKVRRIAHASKEEGWVRQGYVCPRWFWWDDEKHEQGYSVRWAAFDKDVCKQLEDGWRAGENFVCVAGLPESHGGIDMVQMISGSKQQMGLATICSK